MIISTSREGVELRILEEEHAIDYFMAIEANKDHLSQFDDQTAHKYPTLKSVWESIVEPSNPDRLRFGIWDDEQFVGSANITPDGSTAEVGYWLDSSFTGNGYATLAATAVAKYAYRIEGIDVVVAEVVEGNEASIKVLERAGFNETKRLTETKGEMGRIIFEHTRDNLLRP